MHATSRRRFLGLSAFLGFTARGILAKAAGSNRRWTLDLTPGAIGVSAAPLDIVRLAKAHGFESVQPDATYIAGSDSAGLTEYHEAVTAAGLKWGSANLAVEFRRDEDSFRRDLADLPRVARTLQHAGVTRIGTWLMPGHNELDYTANLRLHARRLGEVSRILADAGVRLGLEYVGTPSVRARFQFPFIHRLAEMRDLIHTIQVPGTGLILDSWHWWTAGDRPEDLKELNNADVVAVDLNDAPAGVPLADLQDNHRELPASTGVLPVAKFLGALLAIDYDGPIRAEPFNAALNRLDNDAACAKTIAALRHAMEALKG